MYTSWSATETNMDVEMAPSRMSWAWAKARMPHAQNIIPKRQLVKTLTSHPRMRG